MSGAEVILALGVAASAAQLVEYSIKAIRIMSEIYIRVNDAPKRIVRYTAQIHQIIEAGRAIQETRQLQSPLIHGQLQNVLAEVKHLDQLLGVVRLDYTTGSSTKRVWKKFVGHEERHILTCFKRLEKEKTALLLCLSVFQTQALQKIGNRVETLVERDMSQIMDLIEKFNGESSKTKLKRPGAMAMSPETQIVKKPATVVRRDLQRTEAIVTHQDRQPRSNYAVRRDPAARSGPDVSTSTRPQASPGQTFRNMQASENTTQYNGDYGTGVNGANDYTGSTSLNKSFQVNGNMGSSGNHAHESGQAKEYSIQINGNVGGGITEKKIREDSGKNYTSGSGQGA